MINNQIHVKLFVIYLFLEVCKKQIKFFIEKDSACVSYKTEDLILNRIISFNS